ncbi:Kynurenine--oxoglutarate transaminase 3 [Aphanomyces cochlioides]|nr:Kynurenine--oxoglutarate transaminase 3 [Aphanomyces cochlioides]
MANRLRGFDKPTVWHEFTPLALQHQSVNLGQGFPDWQCDAFVKEAAKAAIDADFNQYARPGGHLRLKHQLAKLYNRSLARGVDDNVPPIHPETDIAVGVGATEVLYSAMMGLVNPGDEVILIEPAFDIYAAQVQMAGGVCKYVPLQFNAGLRQFELDIGALECAFTPKTRVLLLNSPHNPTGTIFPRSDLERIAAIVQRFPNVVVLADDVYENIAFVPLTRFASLPGVWERTITVGSAGKTFSVTGWKVGWAIGPSNLIKSLNLANNWVMFSVATPLQEAVVTMLERAELPFESFPSYYAYLRDRYEKKRDFLAKGLTALGIPIVVAQGGTFLFADVSNVVIPPQYLENQTSRDYAFCRWLTIEKQVTAIPTSAFYSDANKADGHQFVRFAYCKSDDALTTAIARMQSIELLE